MLSFLLLFPMDFSCVSNQIARDSRELLLAEHRPYIKLEKGGQRNLPAERLPGADYPSP